VNLNNELISFIGSVKDVSTDLEIKFGLVKTELEKELKIKSEIVENRKIALVKHLIEKGDPELKNRHLQMSLEKRMRKKNRMLKIDTAQLGLPQKKDMTLNMKTGVMYSRPIAQRRASHKNPEGVKLVSQTPTNDASDNILETMKMQANSINQILGALDGLSDFKKSVNSQIQSISEKVKAIKGIFFVIGIMVR
jgi:hypothetical protein